MRQKQDLTVAGVHVFIDDEITRLQAYLEDLQKHGSLHLICDEHTLQHCLPIYAFLDAFIGKPIILEPGEQHKNLVSCERVWKALIGQGADRHSTVINLGGGVITDLGGFCAATYMRGIPFIHLPTSLMAMCDASLGGKHGIDFDGLKNYIGVIRQPWMVWIDPRFLDSLPARHLRNGMAEIIKYALIGKDPSLLETLQHRPLQNIEMKGLLIRAIDVKKGFVERDVNEHGIRAALNFGHTIGHALESLFLNTREPLLHGGCVALGMIVETWLSHLLFGAPDREICRMVTRLIHKQIPVELHEKISWRALKPYITKDKKHRAGRAGYSLINGIGHPVTGQVIGDEIVEKFFRDNEIALHVPWLTG
jgi:3-dehydroquinate synthase